VLIGHLHGLLSFVFGMVILFIALGPRDLADDLNALLHAHLLPQRVQAQQSLGVPGTQLLSSSQLIEPIFRAALKRKFAVIFWFAAFGAAGAIGYRLLQMLADESSANSTNANESSSAGFVESAQHVEAALAWMPAQLMCAALALASDFDAVARGWREHQQSHQRGWLDVDLGFLASTAKACMDIDDVDDVPASSADSRLPPESIIATDDTAPIIHAQQLLGRITIAWLLAMAVLVMAAYLV
jgi:AmpE protein